MIKKLGRLLDARSGMTERPPAAGLIARAGKYTDMAELRPELLRVFVAGVIVCEKEVKYSRHAPQVVGIRFRDFDQNEANDPFFAETTEKADSADALSA
ncbi:MAG: DUF4368 domain-containing protein [Bacillota bacterium]|nr:DUF4368 domain-containing protein [Bacillota bacterium]